MPVIVAVIRAWEEGNEFQRNEGEDEDKTLHAPAQVLNTIVLSRGFSPTGERPSRNLRAAASRMTEERDKVRTRAHHAHHLTFAMGQKRLTFIRGHKEIRIRGEDEVGMHTVPGKGEGAEIEKDEKIGQHFGERWKDAERDGEGMYEGRGNGQG